MGGSPNGIKAVITEDVTDLREGTGNEEKVLALKCKYA